MNTARVRLSWTDYFLGICDAVAARSIDVETQVDCVIVNQHRRIVSTGYNGFPAGVDDSFWPRSREERQLVPLVALDRKMPAVTLPTGWVEREEFYRVDKYAAMAHAEMNAVVSAVQDLHGCTLYSQMFPCAECAKVIITAGIRKVVYRQTREHELWAVAKELFIQAGVEMFQAVPS